MPHPSLSLSGLLALKAATLQRLAFLTGLTSSGPKALLAARLLESLDQYGSARANSSSSSHISTNLSSINNTSREHAASRLIDIPRNNLVHVDADLEKRHAGDTQKILSIDMGIRNLAYCVLELPHDWPWAGRRTGRLVAGSGPSSNVVPANSTMLPKVTAWRRLPIAELKRRQDGSGFPDRACAPQAETTTNALIVSANEEAMSTSRSTSMSMSMSKSKSPRTPPFSLPETASQAHALVEALVIDPPAPHLVPTTILIERQRWRSMGNPAVLQWTLMVNTLEAALWGALTTARRGGLWRPSRQVQEASSSGPGDGIHAVDPGMVGRYWEATTAAQKQHDHKNLQDLAAHSLDEEEDDSGDDVSITTTIAKPDRTTRKKLKPAKEGKKDKIDLVGRWLVQGDGVTFAPDVLPTRTRFLERWQGRRSSRSTVGSVDSGGQAVESATSSTTKRKTKETTTPTSKNRTKGRSADSHSLNLDSYPQARAAEADGSIDSAVVTHSTTTDEQATNDDSLGDQEEESRLVKLDDLADCLLQGVAWLRWEENRKLLAERGLEALKDLEVDDW